MSVIQEIRAFADCRGMTRRQVIQRVGRLDRENSQLICAASRQVTVIDELTAERNQLQADFDRAAIAYFGLLEDLREANAELAELRAFKANAEAVSVPPLERDTSAVEDQATGPIDVRELRAQHAAPVPLQQAPFAVTDPGQVRQISWGRGADDTQPIPAAGEVA